MGEGNIERLRNSKSKETEVFMWSLSLDQDKEIYTLVISETTEVKVKDENREDQIVDERTESIRPVRSGREKDETYAKRCEAYELVLKSGKKPDPKIKTEPFITIIKIKKEVVTVRERIELQAKKIHRLELPFLMLPMQINEYVLKAVLK